MEITTTDEFQKAINSDSPVIVDFFCNLVFYI